MRQLPLLVFLCCTSLVCGQDMESEAADPRDIGKNEISLNAFNGLFFTALDGAYERILSNTTSLSLEVFYNKYNWEDAMDSSSDAIIYSKEFSVLSKFKYFLKEEKTARGLYAEGIAMYSRGINKTTTLIPASVKYPSFEDFGIGLGLGYKYVAPKGFLLDSSYGIGRNLFDKDSPGLFFVFNINIGYRF